MNKDLLEGLLSAKDPAAAQIFVSELIENVIDPVASRFVAKRLRVSLYPNNDSAINQDGLEIIGDVRVAMLSVLERLRDPEDQLRVESLEGYTLMVARNLVNEYFRRKYPERFRLQNQLRYIFSRTSTLWLRGDSEGNWVCGIRDNEPIDIDIFVPTSLNGNVEGLISALHLKHKNIRSFGLAKLAEVILCDHKEPIAFNHLIYVIGELRGNPEPTSVELVHDIATADRALDPITGVYRKEFLKAVWDELEGLPLRHRRSLLMHLADAQNDNLLIFFPLEGIASIRMISEMLEMSVETVVDLWNRLPLPDSEIAGLMGLERQQVINLRQSARRSLRIRLANRGFFGVRE